MNKQPSRTGKDKKTGKETKEKSTKSTEKQITTLCEIVPGKFNENDWNILLDTDDAQDFVLELIDEVFDNSTKIIYEKYLDRQTIPFTTNEAKKAILHIIEWQFLSKDANDDLKEVFVEDTEPESCIIDSWAQGYVQAYEYDNIQSETRKHNFEEEKQNGNFLKELNKIINEPKETNMFDSTEDMAYESVNGLKPKEKSAISKKTKSIMKKIEFVFEEDKPKKEHARVKKIDPEAKKLDESIAKAPPACQTTLKSLLGRPESRKEIEIDLDGNIKYMNKLDFDKLPGQSVKARFVINENLKPDNFETMRRSKISMISNTENSEKFTNSLSTFDAYLGTKISSRKPPQKSKRSLYDEEDLVLEPAPGVTFTLQNSTRIGPKRQLVPSRQQSLFEKSETFLKPVKQLDKTDIETRRSLHEILDGYPLLSKPDPYNQLKRIPPINSSTTVN